MKTFTNVCAQGDVLFRKIAALPKNLKEQVAKNGELTITHSETGHDHVMVMDKPTTKKPAAQLYNGDNPLISWLAVNRPTSLDHKREHHTHESIMFEPGIYEVRRQQESTPEGWRRVAD